uniref:Uncharacterized protein n=1 Tax=Anopheles darlingi TaxID=43151 RepID=A0A2M4CX77_ANODA
MHKTLRVQVSSDSCRLVLRSFDRPLADLQMRNVHTSLPLCGIERRDLGTDSRRRHTLPAWRFRPVRPQAEGLPIRFAENGASRLTAGSLLLCSVPAAR